MAYTLTRTWNELDGGSTRERRETVDCAVNYAETERRARILWAAFAGSREVAASAKVVIQDATGRVVCSVQGDGSGAPTLVADDGESSGALRWLEHLRETGVLAERVRQSAERLSCLGSGDLTGEPGAETLDACAARLKALILRVDEILSRSLVHSGRDGHARLDTRRALDEVMDGADVDGYLAMTSSGRIQVPPSTLPRERIPAVVEATLRVSEAMLRACAIIEAHAASVELQSAPAPGR